MPKRDKKLIEKRREYIQERISKAQQPTKEIRKIAQELFLSERQVFRDLSASNSNH